jgi:hypothetical protein
MNIKKRSLTNAQRQKLNHLFTTASAHQDRQFIHFLLSQEIYRRQTYCPTPETVHQVNTILGITPKQASKG